VNAVPADLALDVTMRQYLLGQLDEVTRLRMEERLVTDAPVADALTLVEQDLCEDYLDDLLTPIERRGFETTVLAVPAGRRRLEAINAIRQAASSEVRRPVPAALSLRDRVAAFFQLPAPMAVALAAVAVIASISSVTLMLDRQRLRDEAADAHRRLVAAEHARAAAPAAPADVTPEPPPPQLALAPTPARTATPLVALSLRAGALRGDGPGFRRVALPGDAVLLRLTLEMADITTREYLAEVTDADGERVMAIAGLPANRRGAIGAVTLDIPASVVPPGDYQVQLSDAAGAGAPLPRYAFRVLRP
jgi:hypothetical protein